MSKPKQTKSLVRIRIAIVVTILFTIGSALWLLYIPSDIKNVVVFNISAMRLSLLAFLCFSGIALCLMLTSTFKRPYKVERLIKKTFSHPTWPFFTLATLVISIFITWITLFAPTYLLGSYFSMVERLRPLILWAFSILLTTIILSFQHRPPRKLVFHEIFKEYGAPVILVLLIAFSIQKIYPVLTDELWFGRYSVPILYLQIIFTWFSILFIKQAISAFKWTLPPWLEKRFDLVIFIFLWALAVILWLPQPIEFMDNLLYTAIEQHLRPFPPTSAIQPWKDSNTYYMVTTSVQIGRGIYRSIDKPLFLAFSSLINWLASGNYLRMLNLQIFILAFYPPVIYMIGKKTVNRSTGLLAGLLAVFQELNALRIMDEFPLVSAKVLLTEPYMTFWNALIVIALILALSRGDKPRWLSFLIAGGTLGLSALFRLNTMIIIPFIFLLIFIDERKFTKSLFLKIGVFTLGILLALSPWMIHNAIVFNNPVAFIRSKVSGVIVKNRYQEIISQTSEDYFLEEFKSANADSPKLKTIPNLNQPTIQNIETVSKGSYTKLTLSILRHFLNNLITSISILPTSSIPQDLFHASRAQPFWGKVSAEQYENINPVVVFLNLVIIGLGIARTIKIQPAQGLASLAVYIGYHFSNGLAISSGNRYAQPASWIVIFYFATGLICISDCVLNLINGKSSGTKISAYDSLHLHKPKNWPTIIVIVLIILIGATPVYADLVPGRWYLNFSESDIVDLIVNDPTCRIIQKNMEELSAQSLQKIIEKHAFTVTYGRAINPMVLDEQTYRSLFLRSKKELLTDDRFLTFTLISLVNEMISQVYFFGDDPDIPLQNGSDVLLIMDSTSNAFLISIIENDLQKNYNALELSCFAAPLPKSTH